MKNKSILLVDDEINVLNALKRGLICENIKCFAAISGDEALEIMEKNDIAVIVTDMRMPGMNGLELLKIVKEKYPFTVKIVLSGYAQLSQIITTINQVDIFKFVLKPWDIENEFLDIIREAIDYHTFIVEREATRISQEKRYNLYLNILKSTDEKFAKYEKELDNLKSISMKVIEKLRSYIKVGKEDDDITTLKSNLLNEIYKEYMNSVLSNSNCFTIRDIINGFRKLSLNENNKIKIKLYINAEDTLKLSGNIELLLSIMSAIAELSLFCKDIDDLAITFRNEKDSIIIEMKSSHNFNNYTDDNHSFRKIADEIIPIISSICFTMNCDIIKQEKIESTNIIFVLRQQK